MDRAMFQDWLNRYIDAWRTGDSTAIGDLFSADAAYFYGPYREPVVGREAIVRDWLANPDEPGSWEAEYGRSPSTATSRSRPASRGTRTARRTATSSSVASTA